MKSTVIYDKSYIGQFIDKAVEKEYFDFEMKRHYKAIKSAAIIFGIIYMLFIIYDYLEFKSSLTFIRILTARSLFLFTSIAVYIAINKMQDYSTLAPILTIYELVAIIVFLYILHQYDTLSVFSFLSVVVINLAIYVTPNKFIYSSVLTVFLNMSYFVFNYIKIEVVDTSSLLKIIAYDLIIIIFCNIGAYNTNLYKRKQFEYSRELLKASTTDSMTGIYNRAKFNEELNKWINYSNRYDTPLSLVEFDVDEFKKINDSFGHPYGDKVIQQIVLTVKNTIRNTDIFARYGGDEFVILLTNADFEQAAELVERIRNNIMEIKFDKLDKVSCSFGMCMHKENEDSETLIQRADNQLYIDKARCKDKSIQVN